MRIPVRKQVMWWGIAAFTLALTLWLLGQAVLPFILGAGIAYLLDPVADRLERAGLSRTLSVVVITFAVVLAFVAVMLLVVPILLRQATALVETAPQMLEQGRLFFDTRFPDLIPQGAGLQQTLVDLQAAVGEQAGRLASTVLGSVTGVLGGIALLVIVPVVAFYLLLDWDNMVEAVDRYLPREHAGTIRQLASEIDDALSGFLRGQAVVIAILGTWYALGLMFVGLPFGFFIGIMAAVLSFIPYVGVLIGGATAIGVALFSFWGDPLWIGAVVAIFAIGQIVEGNYLQPKIVGGHVGLHPVWLLLALSVFGTLFGFVGLVMAVPMAAALGVLARFLIARYRDSSLFTGQAVPDEPAQPLLVEMVPTGTVADRLRAARMASDRVRSQQQIDAMQEDLTRRDAEG
ncbi:AI-2E family transporter [Paracoccus liaowanqingii]|uniref:AI-2E family transporter n=1 Tax=Paracoccus liaowanqingii TaxID=2560053 RepID=A0A4P7HJ56_9RHOB|nr:AI-2E family transporter [Paracoccus liaowanqingii]QBX34158.1 AI-2E family transporter [Paracoccus liaowanqingii]TGN67797.1 AI-2E family transporter [Paracoccus liaowanqingii]